MTAAAGDVVTSRRSRVDEAEDTESKQTTEHRRQSVVFRHVSLHN